MRTLRIAMVQMNPTVGDLPGNVRRIKGWLHRAKHAKVDLVAFPELAITGYQPEDLLFKPQFVFDNRAALAEVMGVCDGLVAVVGYVGQGEQLDHRGVPQLFGSADRYELYNAAALIANRKLIGSYKKWYLPNYGVFDENRYFHPGKRLPLLTVNGTTIGVNICEDIWLPEGPTRKQVSAGAEVIVNINASPFHIGKSRAREQMLATRARENGVFVIYVNAVGGQDELVFDGNSVALDQRGEVIARARPFEEDLLVVDLDVEAVWRRQMALGRKRTLSSRTASTVDRLTVAIPTARTKRSRVISPLSSQLTESMETYQALVLGVKDYVEKNGFTQVIIGLSGGVDSALTAVIAVDALGAKNVLGIFMPSPYTSLESGEDVAQLVQRLGIGLQVVPITPMLEAYNTSLAASFKGLRHDITEENIQARIRGNILMAFSNKFGHLVLTTGNKSELSVGYSTLYGDMAGGFGVIKDVSKTMVYELANLRNQSGSTQIIPKRILDRPPTAELRVDQKDEDTLPPYAILDPILRAYVEDDRSVDEIVDAGFDRATVIRVVALVDRSEFKRRQAPIGIKIAPRALGKDRRMPITNGYHSV